MDKVKSFIAWFVTLAMFTVYLFSIWNCKGEFAVQVQLDSVEVSKIFGKASKVTGSLKVSGESCEYNGAFEGVADSTGCVAIDLEVCGQRVHEKICGLQRGSAFKRSMTLKKGGMMVIQVPSSFQTFGAWQVRSLVTGDTATVEFSNTPFGYTPVQTFVPEVGKKIIFARWRAGFKDSVVLGDLFGEFDVAFRGIDTIKWILGGLIEFRDGSVGVDSNYVFAEFPAGVYSFADVPPYFKIPLHLVEGNWIVLTDSEASLLILPNVGTTKYLALLLEGADGSQVNPTYMLSSESKFSFGTFAGSRTIAGRTVLIIGFSRTDFFTVVDSTKPQQDVILTGTLTTVPYTSKFKFTSTLSFGYVTSVAERIAGVVPRNFELYQNYPNPFDESTTIRYDIPATSWVSLKVYDNTGHPIATLVNEIQAEGSYKVPFASKNYPSGIYIYELKAGGYIATKKMIVVR